MSAYVVRDATPKDAAAILRVRALTWQTAYAHIFPKGDLRAMSAESSTNWGMAWWREVIEDAAPRSHTLVADASGEVVGIAHLGAERDETVDREVVGELYAIYVLPESSGNGIGQALMAETLSRLRTDDFAEAVLWVLEDNPRTRRFYELAGWRLDGGFKDEEWLGTLVREVRYRISLEPAA